MSEREAEHEAEQLKRTADYMAEALAPFVTMQTGICPPLPIDNAQIVVAYGNAYINAGDIRRAAKAHADYRALRAGQKSTKAASK